DAVRQNLAEYGQIMVIAARREVVHATRVLPLREADVSRPCPNGGRQTRVCHGRRGGSRFEDGVRDEASPMAAPLHGRMPVKAGR
ncbi:MAG TPA: hypothetical protein PLO65_05195, partial [Caulobacter sp.]|nr:hypothetical protein [Caulobacter sp.]